MFIGNHLTVSFGGMNISNDPVQIHSSSNRNVALVIVKGMTETQGVSGPLSIFLRRYGLLDDGRPWCDRSGRGLPRLPSPAAEHIPRGNVRPRGSAPVHLLRRPTPTARSLSSNSQLIHLTITVNVASLLHFSQASGKRQIGKYLLIFSKQL